MAAKDGLPPGSSVRTDGPTPNGGIYSVAYYRDARGNPAPRDRAVSVEIVEFGPGDVEIRRTYGDLRGKG